MKWICAFHGGFGGGPVNSWGLGRLVLRTVGGILIRERLLNPELSALYIIVWVFHLWVSSLSEFRASVLRTAGGIVILVWDGDFG